MQAKKRRQTLILSLVLSLVLMLTPLASFAQGDALIKPVDNKIQAEVLKHFEAGETEVEVLVKLKDQAPLDHAITQAQQADSFEQRTDLRENLITTLESTASKSQANLLQYVDAQKLLGGVSEVESFYIVNMVYLKANQEVIEAISLMDEVEKIYFNETVYLIGHEEQTEGSIEVDVIEEALGGFSSEEVSGETDITTSAVTSSDIEWNIKQVKADLTWNQLGIDGTGVVIGVIDSGVTWDHPALKNKYRGYNPATGTVNHNGSWFDAHAGQSTPYDDPQSPHGTHVTGTILGQEATGRNAIGSAPGAKFIAAKALGPNGGSSSSLLSAAQWMLRPGGSAANAPAIVCNSWGGGDGIDDWFRGAVRAWRAAGILPVFAAGNQRPGEPAPWPGSISIPSNYPESFAVGATDINNIRGSFSKLGPSPYDKTIPKPDISAPGVNIRSSVISGYQGGWSGTSMACPNVCGVAAMVLQANPRLSISEIESILKSTATRLTDSTYPTSPNMGYGYGLVNAYEAVRSAQGGTPPVDPPTEKTGTVSGRITSTTTGYGISGATITISGTNLSTRTDSIGYYTLNSVPAGTQTLVCSASGYNSISGSINVQANQTITVNGKMSPSQPVNQNGTVTGTVVNTYGSTMSSVRVTINGTSLSTYTSSNGTFRFDKVPAGQQTITFTRYGYKTLSGTINVTAGQTINLKATMAQANAYWQGELPIDKPAPIDEIEKPIIRAPINSDF